MLVGNKKDVGDNNRAVKRDEAAMLAATWPNCTFTEISAKHYDEVEEAMRLVVKEILNLEQENKQETTKKTGCHCRIL